MSLLRTNIGKKSLRSRSSPFLSPSIWIDISPAPDHASILLWLSLLVSANIQSSYRCSVQIWLACSAVRLLTMVWLDEPFPAGSGEYSSGWAKPSFWLYSLLANTKSRTCPLWPRLTLAQRTSGDPPVHTLAPLACRPLAAHRAMALSLFSRSQQAPNRASTRSRRHPLSSHVSPSTSRRSFPLARCRLSPDIRFIR